MTEKLIKIGGKYYIKNRPIPGMGSTEVILARHRLRDTEVTITDIRYDGRDRPTRLYIDKDIYFTGNELTPQRCDKAKCPCH